VAQCVAREETHAAWGIVSASEVIENLIILHPSKGLLSAEATRVALEQHDASRDPQLLREAEWLSGRAVTLAPDHPGVWWTRAVYLDTAGDSLAAMQAMDRVERLPGASAQLSLASAELCERGGRHVEALAACDRAIESVEADRHLTSGERRLAWLTRSRLQSRLGNAAAARADRNRAYGLDTPSHDPHTPANLIDLRDFYTASLDADWRASRFSRHNLSGLARGRQVLGGVEYEVQGLVQLSSTLLETRQLHYPQKVQGIQVQQRCRRLHFLHAADSATGYGDTVAIYTVRWADGREEKVPMRYGIEAMPWDWEPSAANPSAAVAWSGVSPAGLPLWLFRTTPGPTDRGGLQGGVGARSELSIVKRPVGRAREVVAAAEMSADIAVPPRGIVPLPGTERRRPHVAARAASELRAVGLSVASNGRPASTRWAR